MNAKQLLPQAIERGVAYVTGDAFYIDGGGKNTLRLNFSYPEHDEIDRGIERLASLIESAS